MTITYKTKSDINGNVKRVVVNHDNKTYSLGGYVSDIDITVKTKELKELLTVLNVNGYNRT